jgi:hypothetical protein
MPFLQASTRRRARPAFVVLRKPDSELSGPAGTRKYRPD